MGGFFSFFKKRRGNNDRDAGRGNAQRGARQPAGNQGFLDDAVIIFDPRHPEEEIESRAVSNEMQNILSGNYDSRNHGINPAANWMPKRQRGFDDKLSNLGKEELRNLYLKVKNEGDQVLDSPELAYDTPRAYDFAEKDVDKDEFNPGHDDELKQVQKEIDDAGTPVLAFNALVKYAGNEESRLLKSDKETDWDVAGVILKRFKSKLKLMARMIHDYPELAGRIGDMVEIPQEDEETVMSTTGAVGNGIANFKYNARFDMNEAEGNHVRPQSGTDESTYAGTHELGHVLESLLVDNDYNKIENWNNHIVSGNILKEVLNKDDVMSPKQRRKLVYHKKTRNGHVGGQINTTASKLDKKGLTTEYGATNASETFAEAFSDVYQYGKNARKASIEIVKNYERKAKMQVILGLLRRNDSDWLLQQTDPEKFGYSEADEQLRKGVNKTYDRTYQANSPDVHPRLKELPGNFNDAEYERLNRWDDETIAHLANLRNIPGGNNYSTFDVAERDILRVKNLAVSLVTYGIHLPPLPDLDSRGLKPKEFLTFLILGKERQRRAIAEMDKEKSAGKAGSAEEQKVGGESLVVIKDPEKEDVKQPAGKAKGSSDRKKPQPSPVINVNGPNSKISVIKPAGNVGQPGGKKHSWYNKTELRVMEYVERINSGERIHLKLSKEAESKLRPSILAKVREAQKKMGDIE